MALKIATIKNQQSLGATATTFTEDIRLNYNVHSLHLDVFGLKDSTTASTQQEFVDKITDVRISTLSANPESIIDMDDLFDMQGLVFKNLRYHSINTSGNNIPHAYGVQVPLSPFPDDPTRNFGLPANNGVQFITTTAADTVGDYDGFTYDLTLEGLDTFDKPNSLGHCKYIQDSFTSSAVGSARSTIVGPANRLLGIYNFMTTSFDDLAAAATFDVIGIREQQITFSESVASSNKPSRFFSKKPIQTVASFAVGAAVINVLDDGRWYNDFGIQNDNASLGINISGIGQNTSVKSFAGVASELTRVMPIVLV
jgi:hypothetical protein